MRVAFKIVSPSNTGNPDYDICGQGAPALSHVGLALTIEFNGTIIYSEPNVSIGTLPVLPLVIGTRTLSAFTYHPVNGFAFTIDSFDTIGTEDTFKISLSKAGYQSFSNTFNLFDYDFSTDIYLINNTNNLDINGLQTKAFSKFYAYRKPFTDDIYYYNVVGTQGYINYKDISDPLNPIQLFTGQNGVVCAPTGITIEQSISVEDIYNNLLDTCTSNSTIAHLNWLPNINVAINCLPACNDTCVSTLATGTYTNIVDTSNLGCITVDGVSMYPFHNSPNILLINTFYDYQGFEIGKETTEITLNLCGSGCPESPLVLNLPPLPDLGDVIVKTEFVVLTGATIFVDYGSGLEEIPDVNDYIIKCNQTNTLSRCNWFNIEETDTCGEYKVNNCSIDSTVLTIKQLQEDKTFLTISTVTILPLNNVIVNLQTDGVYTFEVPSKVDGETLIYTVINDCILKACLFSKLGNLICGKHEDNCIATIKDYYDFNAFILNLHSYYALLNEEYNFNYIYSVIDITKLNELYTIKQYLDNLSTYCVASCNTCNCGK